MITKALTKRLAPALVLAALSIGTAQAQFFPTIEEKDTRNQPVMQALESYMDAQNGDHTLKKFRTGPDENKPLGNYFQQPFFAFKSAYAKLDLDRQAKFAYDLNQYRKTAGVDWETIHHKAIDWPFMPYEKQADFAQFYWLRQAPEFKGLGIGEKEQFIHESLIDATSTWLAYRRKQETSADTVIYGESAVQHLIKKQP